MKTATELAQKIADMELEACCEWLGEAPVIWNGDEENHPGSYLRIARRTKPPSLKKQALIELSNLVDDLRRHGLGYSDDTIRRALEQLPDTL